jgi:DNA-directed RNA polymerase specialized sigma24 family protein
MRADERRRVLYADGRRVTERRAVLVPVVPPELPAKLRRQVARLVFLEALEMPPGAHDDIESVRAIVRLQVGDHEAFADLYRGWFDRVYAYLRLTLNRGTDYDSQVCAVFVEALSEATRSAPSIADVRAWVLALVYRVASEGRRALVVGGDGSRTSPCTAKEGAAHDARLTSLTDDDLLLLIGRRPLAERHVLLLGYLGGLRSEQVARIMELEASQVRDLHRLAMTSIEASLSAIVRSPRMAGRLPMSRLHRTSRVLDRRRRALLVV